MASARIVVKSRFLFLARSPDFRREKCRVKPVHFQQQFGDLDVRQDHRRLVDQRLRTVRYRRIEWRDLQARLGDDGVRQLVGQRHAVDGGEPRFQQRQPLMHILVAVGGHCQRQFAGLFEASELRGRHQIVLEVLELARALYPDVA
jgi:hypothetical protein